MKIAYLIQFSPELRRPPFDGPANHVRDVFQEWVRQGHQVILLAGWDGQVWTTTDLINFNLLDDPTSREPAHWVERGIRRIQRELRLPYLAYFESRRFAKTCLPFINDCDVIFERMSWMGSGGVMASAMTGKPLVMEFNGDPLFDLDSKKISPQGLQRSVSIQIMQQVLRRSHAIIATGNGWRDNVIQQWKADPHKVTVIENGSALVDMLSRDQLHTFQPPTLNSSINIVFLGGFYAWHGVLIAILAFKRAIDAGIPARMTMIGSGPAWDEAQQTTQQLGLSGRVEFTGALAPEAFAPLLAQAEIGLSPYCGRKEYSGLKLFDYKAAGLAVIASGENGQPAVLEHQKTGWIVPPCEEEALADAMITLCKETELRRRLGQQARIEAEAIHSWDHTAREIIQIFDQLCALNAPEPRAEKGKR